jgi:hypothetical protein
MPTGLQPIPSKSQPTQKQQLTTSDKSSVQTSVRTDVKNNPKQDEIDTSELPSDLIEIVTIWSELPGHIKAAIKALVQTFIQGDKE